MSETTCEHSLAAAVGHHTLATPEEVSEARRLKSLEDENRRLKKLVAEQALDIQMLKDVTSKKW